MPSDQDREEMLLLLLGLVAKPWLSFYARMETEVLSRYRVMLQRIIKIERRATERYRSELSEFRTRVGPGGTRIVRSPRKTVEFEAAMQSVYGPPFARGGQVESRVQRDMRQLSREAALEARAHAENTKALFAAMDLDGDLETPQMQGGILAGSSWAARRDIELMGDKTAHAAAISAFGASDQGLLSAALADAPRAVRIPRSSTRNSIQGSVRQAIRSAVYRSSGTVPSWLSVRPYKGAPGSSLSPRTEAAWIRHAKRQARGAWRPGNPISGHGLHVGSRTYFAPVTGDLAALAAAVLLFLPTYVRDVLRLAPRPSFDKRNVAGVYRIRGRNLESLSDVALSIQDGLDASVAAAAPLPVPVAQLKQQPKIDANVRAIFVGENYITLSIDRGRKQGVEMDMVFRVTSPLPPPVVKGQATVIALYPDFATLFFQHGPQTVQPRLLDVASTLGS